MYNDVYYITTGEENVYILDKELLFQSEFFKTTIEGDKEEKNIRIEHLNDEVFIRVLEFMTYHKNKVPSIIKKPIKHENMIDNVNDPWDAWFIDDVDDNPKLLYKLIETANYLDIQPLLDLACCKVATFGLNVHPSEYAKLLGTPIKILTEDDERMISEDLKWIKTERSLNIN